VVAYNQNTPEYALSKLATDEDWWTRHNVAANPNCPVEIILQLLQDKTSTVRESALERI
jgi:hypothetical protein